MKKRNQILAGALAVLLGISPAGVYGEEIYDVESSAGIEAADEITDVSDAEQDLQEDETAGEDQEPEFTSGIEKGTEAGEELFTDSADTDSLASQDESILEYVEEELDSPLIVNGEPGNTNGIHVFSLEEYDGAYGNQLSGMALEAYNTYVSNLFENYSTFDGVSYEYQLSTPVTFDIEKNEQDKWVMVDNDANNDTKLQIRNSMQAALDAFSYDYPEVFWMRGSGYSYLPLVTRQDGKIIGMISKITIKPALVDGYDTNITENMTSFLSNTESAAAKIQADTQGKSMYEKVKAIHDYVCEKAVYDAQDNFRVHSAGPMFIGDGHVVCEGYAKAMIILCKKMGIDSACIGGLARNSSTSSGEAHMWNYVKMDNDKWYLVDTTWDDQRSGIRTTYFLAGWNSRGFLYTIRDERVEKDTFSTYNPDKNSFFIPQAFIYPLISDESYQTDIAGKISLTSANATIASQTYEYTGNPIQPEVTVVCDGKNLVQGTDYTITYKNNQYIGIADVVLHGTGKYTGTITVHFQIYCGHKNLMHTNGKTAICTEAGNIDYWYCNICGKYFSDAAGVKEIALADTVLPASGHQLSRINGKAATCTEAGNIDYWYCNVCGKYFSDAAGVKEIALSATVLPATGHHYGEYQLTKEATALDEGILTAYCSCGAYVTKAVPVLTPTMKLNVSSLRLRVKQKYTIKVSGLAKGDSVVSWSVANKKCANVKNGIVTGKAKGNTVVTIRLASGYTKKIRVYVQKGIVKTTALKISNTRLSLKRGKSYALLATVAPVTSQEKVTFESSNSKIVSVNSKGKLYARKKGSARITVRSGKKTRVCVVTVR